jgi:tetratricopeptide (TPR) repeat protein
MLNHPIGCDCGIHGRPSLFQMAEKRKVFQENKKLLSKAEKSKIAGNLELVKGKALIQHTAGKNLIADACQHYLAALGSLNQVEQHLMNNSFSGEGNTGTSSSNSENNTESTLLEQWTSLSISVYLNLSLAGLLCEDYNSGLRSAEKALSLDCKNTKALYRCAKCYIGLGKDQDALSTLDKALSISPKNKDVRKEKKRLFQVIQKKKKKEIFEKETRDGLARLALKKQRADKGDVMEDSVKSKAGRQSKETGYWENELAKDVNAKKEKEKAAAENKRKRLAAAAMENTSETIHQMVERLQPTACGLKNGGLGPCKPQKKEEQVGGGKYYMWGQTKNIVHVLIALPKNIKSSDISVSIKRTFCEVGYKSDVADAIVVVLSLPLTRPARADESTWMIEHKGMVHVELVKEMFGEWWENVTPKHPSIDVALCDDGEVLMVDVPEQQKAVYDRAMFEEMQKTPEQRDAEMKKVAMMDEWRKTKRNDHFETQSTTTRNPRKKELYEHLKNQFPHVNIQVKGK